MNREKTLQLDCNRVDVWLINPDDFINSKMLDEYHQLLSLDEKQKLEKYIYLNRTISFLLIYMLSFTKF